MANLDDTTLPRLLITIVERFGRPSDDGVQQLRQKFELWSAGESRAEFEAEWQALTEQVLTRPHWLSMLLPEVCTEFPELLSLVQSLAGAANMPDDRAQEAENALADWVGEQADLTNRDGLLTRLLRDLLHGSPDQGPPFLFLSRYYTWLDLLVARFVEPGLRPLHERIFSMLHIQRSHWANNYCSGYLYQGWEALGLNGIKPTAIRLRQYGITSLLSPTDRVLDLGANNGFLALAVGEHVGHVDAVELNPFLVEIGRTAAAHIGQDNVRFTVADIQSWQPDGPYDAVISLANHCTIDGRMSMDFEAYIAKLFSALRPGGWLFFESHNVFGPGAGGAGDDGDLDFKFDIVERYFELIDAQMHRAFVPAQDVDKLFVKLRRRPAHVPAAQRRFSLAQARHRYLDEATLLSQEQVHQRP